MPHKLLLADDSVTIQRVIELTFADEDIQVITVGDGKQAIARIQEERPDIVLADVGMPERDGYDVAAFIKSEPTLAGIPVLLLTGAFEPVDEQRARAAGCDGVLAKPFEPQMVITRVKELLAASARVTRPPERREASSPSASGAPLPSVLPALPSAPPALPSALPTLPSAAAQATAEAVAQPQAPPARVTTQNAPSILGLSDRQAFPGEPERTPAPAAFDPSADALRIKRREPVKLDPLAAAPPVAAHPEQPAAFDDYFDRLDAAFATLNSPGAAPPAENPPLRAARPEPPIEPPSRPFAERPAVAAPVAPSPRPPSPPPPPEPVRAERPRDYSFAPLGVPAPSVPSPFSAPPAVADAPGGRYTSARSFEPSSYAQTPALADAGSQATAPVTAPIVAQAFSALLDAERTEGAPVPYLAPEPAMTDELVEQVAQRVLERLTDRVVRDRVTEIVSTVAERLVRAEIDRIKGGFR